MPARTYHMPTTAIIPPDAVLRVIIRGVTLYNVTRAAALSMLSGYEYGALDRALFELERIRESTPEASGLAACFREGYPIQIDLVASPAFIVGLQS